MAERIPPETEYKLVILSVLERLGGITPIQLLQFLVEQDLMGYFPMQLHLSEMIEQGQVIEQPHPLDSLLLLSESGRAILQNLSGRLPAGTAAKLNQDMTAWKLRVKAEQQTIADTFDLSEHRQGIRLRLLEGGNALIDLLMLLPQAEYLSFLQRRWSASAQSIYALISEQLGMAFDPQASPAELPPQTDLHVVGSEWLLSMETAKEDAPEPTFTLMMTLPDEALARHFAARWPQVQQELRRSIIEILRQVDVG